jgi:TRAP-type C4-dicarboxylate transport system permease small subunit
MPTLESWVYRQLERLVACEMFLLMLTVTVDVAGRYLFNKPLPAGYELVQVQMGLLAFTAMPLLSRTNEHISLGLLDHLFKGWYDRLRRFAVHLLSAAGMAFLASRIWAYARQLASMDESTPVLGVPLAPLGQFMAVMAAVGAALLALLAVRCLRRSGA